MSGDRLDAMRGTLTGLTGPARTRPLLELGQELGHRYWQRVGRPDGLAYLDEAIGVIGEAYGYFAAGDAWRVRVASELGWLNGVRFLVHAGAESDRDSGISLLAEALDSAQLPAVLRDLSQLALGQLYLSRANRILQSPDVAAMLIGPGLPASAAEDVDRAVGLFRALLSAPTLGAEAVDAARAMLTVAESFKAILASIKGGAAGFDLAGLMRGMQALQDLQRLQNARPGFASAPVFPAMPSLLDADTLLEMDLLDRPVTVVDAPAPAGLPDQPTPQPETIAPDPVAARRELHALLVPMGDLLPALAALLGPDGHRPAVGIVDDLVALSVLAAAGPDATGLDHLALAAALYLRGRLDTGDWARLPGGDLELAGAALATAGRTVRLSEPAAVPVLNRLTALLDRNRSKGRTPYRGAVFVADGNRPATVVEAMRLRRAYYPEALGFGGDERPATPDAVLAVLDTPMLHLACGVTPAGALKLAGATELSPERLRTARASGGLAVLPPTGVGLPALGDALLAAGFEGVVTWKRVVPVGPAALMLFVLHAALVAERLDPAAAVARVREWMRDPRRTKPVGLPDEYAGTFARGDLTDEAYWGALVHRGR
jgi:hypothetical protein